MKVLKFIFVILILVFWFFGTYLYGLSSVLRVRSHGFSDGNFLKINNRILSGYSPLKNDLRLFYLEDLFGMIYQNPNILSVPEFVRSFDLVIKQTEKSLVLSPQNLTAVLQLARAYAFMGQKEQAVLMLNQALRLSPLKETTLWASFRLLVFMGMDEESRRVLEYLSVVSPSFINNVSINAPNN